MTVAIASDGEMVSAHLGHCAEFAFFDITDGVVGAKETEPNGDHQVGMLPGPLRSRKVDCVIAGGMGMRAQQNLSDAGISFILGVTGRVEDAAAAFAAGEIEPGESLCNHG